MKKIRCASRDSRLAVIQSRIVTDMINSSFPEYETELMTMKTMGDIRLDIKLDKIGGRGLFVKELDRALLSGEADISIHSLKDMPAEVNEELPVIAYSKRNSPFDVLVLPKSGIADLSAVGCSSDRRAYQFMEMYPDACIKPIRGNVLTRIEKLDRGEYSALILAQAGLERLGMTERISRVFTPKEIVPAAGQGIIAVQCRKGFEFLGSITDREAEICAKAELACVRYMNGGCSVPLGVYTAIEEGRLHIYGYYNKEGRSVRKEIYGDISSPEELGKAMAEELKI
ncbi:MAG: hydroxymethylbilane synthase [Firmicutes bacterium]|nr:hydroxymethylbilane synthase [Bacillota bacterium]